MTAPRIVPNEPAPYIAVRIFFSLNFSISGKDNKCLYIIDIILIAENHEVYMEVDKVY